MYIYISIYIYVYIHIYIVTVPRVSRSCEHFPDTDPITETRDARWGMRKYYCRTRVSLDFLRVGSGGKLTKICRFVSCYGFGVLSCHQSDGQDSIKLRFPGFAYPNLKFKPTRILQQNLLWVDFLETRHKSC